MNIEVKSGRKEGTINLVMGQVSAAFLLEVAGNAVEAQAKAESGMAAQMFSLLVSEFRTALAEVKAMVPDPFADTPADKSTRNAPANNDGDGDGDGDGDDKKQDGDDKQNETLAASNAIAATVANATGKGTKVDAKA